MSHEVFGLLVAVNDYQPPVGPPLRGAVPDIRRWQTYLTDRLGQAARLLTLTDAAATRRAVIDGFRTHLSQAGPGDTALFVFSGHGSQEQPPVEFVGDDASGKLQNLLFFDTGQVVDGVLVRQLADKELSLLLGEVAARGPRVVVILDCCHSGDATRSGLDVARRWLPHHPEQPAAQPDAGERGAVENVLLALWGPRPIDAFLDGTFGRSLQRVQVAHVALTACQATETARERQIDGEWCGLFTSILLDTLEEGDAIDYRSLVEVVRTRLTALGVEQRPELFPTESGGAGDGVFLGDVAGPELPPFVMTQSDGRWVVSAGELHGLRQTTGGDACRLCCYRVDGGPCGEVRVVSVDAGTSVVEPLGWLPDAPSYRADISWMPFADVIVDGPNADGSAASPAMVDAVRSAIEASGSALLRVSPMGSPSNRGVVTLRVAPTAGEAPGSVGVVVAIDDPTTTTAGSFVPWSAPDAAGIAVRRLEHLARWERLRRLGEQRSDLAGGVELQIFRAPAGSRVVPDGLAPLLTAAEYVLAYSSEGPPRLFLRLRNSTARDLWVALIDLSDDWSATVLLPAAKISAGVALDVDPEGRPWEFALSAEAEALPCGTARERLKVLVSDAPFDASPFELRAIGTARRSAGIAPVTEWAATTTTLVITRGV